MARSSTAVVIILAIITLSVSSFGQTKPVKRRTMTADGIVLQTDFVASTILLRVGQRQLLINVPNGTKITQGTDTILFADIEISDSLTVQYYITGSGEMKAVRITDNNLANAF